MTAPIQLALPPEVHSALHQTAAGAYTTAA